MVLVTNFGLMVQDTKGIEQMTSQTDTESCIMLLEIYLKGSDWTEKRMVKALTPILMGRNMLEIGRMTSKMELGQRSGPMGLAIKEITKMEGDQGWESFLSQIILIMKVNSLRIALMAMECIYVLMAESMKAHG